MDNYVMEIKRQNAELWRCPQCGYEQHGSSGILRIFDHEGCQLASSRACPVCLVEKLKNLVPELERVEDSP